MTLSTASATLRSAATRAGPASLVILSHRMPYLRARAHSSAVLTANSSISLVAARAAFCTFVPNVVK